jgi:membrane associated rhomboid family serine protease
MTALWALIAVCVVMYLATLAVPSLVGRLGLAPAIIADRPWTIISAIFIHGSIWHLLFNMVALFFFGRYASLLLGDGWFTAAFLIGGICGNLLYLALGPPFSIAIGASGAIFALGGVLAVMRPRLSVFVFPIPAPLPLWAAVVIGFLVVSVFPGVAWQAHLGGLASGVIMGYFFRRRERTFRRY